MNYLAHSYFNATDDQLVGNMIADFIKNNERANFSIGIQKGIHLHREIDSFTDSHEAVSRAKKLFSPLVRLYSGAFIDVSFDYFLAHSMSESTLLEHSQKVYTTLWNYENILPDTFKKMLEKMEKDNWLYNYRNDWGIDFSMQNVLNKAKYLDKSLPIFELFLQHKKEIGKEFDVFFPDIISHIKCIEL